MLLVVRRGGRYGWLVLRCEATSLGVSRTRNNSVVLRSLFLSFQVLFAFPAIQLERAHSICQATQSQTPIYLAAASSVLDSRGG
jgi:hypothetical protein